MFLAIGEKTFHRNPGRESRAIPEKTRREKRGSASEFSRFARSKQRRSIKSEMVLYHLIRVKMTEDASD
jgi:hypothetical protein